MMNTFSPSKIAQNSTGFDLSAIIRIPGAPVGEPYCSLIREFLLSLYQGGYAKQTIRSYGWHLNRLADWLQTKGIEEPQQIERKVLREWGCILRTQYQPQTQKLAITAAKVFNKWLVTEEICEDDYTQVLQTPGIKTTPQRTLTLLEITKMLDVCNVAKPKGIRDVAIITLLLETGLRASELCNLTLDDVSMTGRKLNILSKGGDQEPGYFSFLCSEYLEGWLEIRSSLTKMGRSNHFFFVSIGGLTPSEKLTASGLRRILRILGERAGVEGVSPHAFRRSFATLRIKLGQSTRSVQLLGRWKDLKVFERYTQALLCDDDFGRACAGEFTPLRKIRPRHAEWEPESLAKQ